MSSVNPQLLTVRSASGLRLDTDLLDLRLQAAAPYLDLRAPGPDESRLLVGEELGLLIGGPAGICATPRTS